MALVVGNWLYWTPFIALITAVTLVLVGWYVLARRYQKIVEGLRELSQHPENIRQDPIPQVVEIRNGLSNAQEWCTEFRRMMGDVLAVGFQLCAVERAREQHPELDMRITGQLKDRGISLVSRIWLFVEGDDNRAQDLVKTLRAWILDPQADRHAEWERRTYELAQDVIRRTQLCATTEQATRGPNFSPIAAD